MGMSIHVSNYIHSLNYIAGMSVVLYWLRSYISIPNNITGVSTENTCVFHEFQYNKKTNDKLIFWTK